MATSSLREEAVPDRPVLHRLLRVPDDHESPLGTVFADHDLLDLEVVAHRPEAPGSLESFLVDLLGAAQLLADDDVAAAALEVMTLLLAGKAPVDHPHHPGQLPPGQVPLHLVDGRRIRRVAGPRPAPHRDAASGHRQPDDDLRQVLPVILGVPVLPEAAILVRLLELAVGARRVEEQQVDLEVEQIRHGEEHRLLDLLAVLHQEVHRPVQRVRLDRVQPFDVDLPTDPPLHRELRPRRQGPVGDHGEEQALDLDLIRPLGKELPQSGVELEAMPEGVQQVRAADRERLLDGDVRAIAGEKAGLDVGCLVVTKEAVDALDETSQALLVDALAAAEVMEDERLGTLGLRVSEVVGELDVLGDGAVLVGALHRPQVHGYMIAVYYITCQ